MSPRLTDAEAGTALYASTSILVVGFDLIAILGNNLFSTANTAIEYSLFRILHQI